jgi:hypothetical protein
MSYRVIICDVRETGAQYICTGLSMKFDRYRYRDTYSHDFFSIRESLVDQQPHTHRTHYSVSAVRIHRWSHSHIAHCAGEAAPGQCSSIADSDSTGYRGWTLVWTHN